MKIVIEGTPIAKKRHRCACRGRKPISYDPQLKEDMENVRFKMTEAFNEVFENLKTEQPVGYALEASELTMAKSFEVSFTFMFPPNKSDTLAKRNAKLWGFQSHNTKPDFDNLAKFYADCATGVLWEDDCQVVIGDSKKIYHENPRTEIDIKVKKGLQLNPKAEGVLLIFGPEKLKSFLKDIQAFWPWPACRVDEIREIEEHHRNKQEETLTALAALLIEFGVKYGDELKKIQKFKGPMPMKTLFCEEMFEPVNGGPKDGN
jgi:Holliday junction resolvase RusA-like endonuclease